MTSTTTIPPTDPFPFPPTYNFPPFFTPQPNRSTRSAQLQKWSALIQAWCRHHRTFRLSIIEAVESPLFHNATLRKRVSLGDARDIVDWMAAGADEDGSAGGGKRAEWVDANQRSVAWIWWRRPEEWAGLVADWVENTGQKNVVLTVYELLEGEATISQEWHGMDPDVMLRSLNVLVKRGKAQVFGSEGQEGVKFF
ncbi:ESCRT-II complex, vps25 subunit [Aspergillus steynii IBT 23096]|uniref:Vacuolar protein-sorting-associated protein 25 n=1 Tax=Aspergillus steynii IBT 23096 TaxID=1392250 RepID=A0A2I2G1J0_9EURO|nr:ESCRT-II complex, vps25 subunit [Aspergillus steynii IBT 23096]PLB46741.1 ESCRT-II complex, vps25 subunit [Aspergillus steynii IBT 23096]